MNLKQQLFVGLYTEGETKGNCAASMRKAGYSKGYVTGHCGTYIVGSSCIQDGIDKAMKYIEGWKNGGRELCDRLFSAQYKASINAKDRTNAIRCVENKAKNVGYYAEDNAQRAEKAKLTAVQVEEAKKYAQWRLLKGLSKLPDEPEPKKYCLKCHKEIGTCACQKGFYTATEPQTSETISLALQNQIKAG